MLVGHQDGEELKWYARKIQGKRGVQTDDEFAGVWMTYVVYDQDARIGNSHGGRDAGGKNWVG